MQEFGLPGLLGLQALVTRSGTRGTSGIKEAGWGELLLTASRNTAVPQSGGHRRPPAGQTGSASRTHPRDADTVSPGPTAGVRGEEGRRWAAKLGRGLLTSVFPETFSSFSDRNLLGRVCFFPFLADLSLWPVKANVSMEITQCGSQRTATPRPLVPLTSCQTAGPPTVSAAPGAVGPGDISSTDYGVRAPDVATTTSRGERSPVSGSREALPGHLLSPAAKMLNPQVTTEDRSPPAGGHRSARRTSRPRLRPLGGALCTWVHGSARRGFSSSADNTMERVFDTRHGSCSERHANEPRLREKWRYSGARQLGSCGCQSLGSS